MITGSVSWRTAVACLASVCGLATAQAQSFPPQRGALGGDGAAGVRLNGFPALRSEASFDAPGRHGLRVQRERFGLLAGQQDLASDAPESTEPAGISRFDQYRLTWRYTLLEDAAWTWRIGFTGLTRDVRQGPRLGASPVVGADTGLSPMLHAYGAWRPARHWSLVAEVDGMGVSDRRIWDLGLSARYEFAPNWHAGFGYRLLDTGTEVRAWQTLGRFSGATLSVGYRF